MTMMIVLLLNICGHNETTSERSHLTDTRRNGREAKRMSLEPPRGPKPRSKASIQNPKPRSKARLRMSSSSRMILSGTSLRTLADDHTAMQSEPASMENGHGIASRINSGHVRSTDPRKHRRCLVNVLRTNSFAIVDGTCIPAGDGLVEGRLLVDDDGHLSSRSRNNPCADQMKLSGQCAYSNRIICPMSRSMNCASRAASVTATKPA